MPNDERILETMPDGALGLIPLKSCEELGAKVDQYLVGERKENTHTRMKLHSKVITATLTSSPHLYHVLEQVKQKV